VVTLADGLRRALTSRSFPLKIHGGGHADTAFSTHSTEILVSYDKLIHMPIERPEHVDSDDRDLLFVWCNSTLSQPLKVTSGKQNTAPYAWIVDTTCLQNHMFICNIFGFIHQSLQISIKKLYFTQQVHYIQIPNLCTAWDSLQLPVQLR